MTLGLKQKVTTHQYTTRNCPRQPVRILRRNVAYSIDNDSMVTSTQQKQEPNTRK